MGIWKNYAISMMEKGRIPDTLIKKSIGYLIKSRLNELKIDNCEARGRLLRHFIHGMGDSPIAMETRAANEQHYEVPARFFELVLGTHRKYSCCYWSEDTKNLDIAESNALSVSSQRARLADGQDILELGCGWGAWTLWVAEHYPHSRITGVSNSNSQREYILSRAKQMKLNNVNVITSDMNEFNTGRTFDRVISIEMFEHMRNYQVLMNRISHWLKPHGKFFMHIFCHKSTPYIFEVKDVSDWMSKYFFTGGIMPSDELPLYFQEDLRLLRHWRWSGQHYEKTANSWLANIDRHKKVILELFRLTYGAGQEKIWFSRWRIFFMACAQMFGYEHGEQWWVSHYLFEKQVLRS